MNTIVDKIHISEQDIINIIDGILKQTSVSLDDGDNEYSFLNIKRYAKKLRIESSKNYIEVLRASDGALNAAYCLCEIIQDVHLQNISVDYTNLDAQFTCIMQTDKLNVLEDLLIRTNLTLIGVKFPIQVIRKDKDGQIISTQNRNGNIVLSRPQTQEIRTESIFGETAIVLFTISFLIFDDLSVYSDFDLSISTDDKEYMDIPYTFFKVSYDAVQRALPNTNLAETGVLNNTSAMTFCFSAYDRIDRLGKLMEKLLFYHQTFISIPPLNGENYSLELAPKNNDIYYLRVKSSCDFTYKYKCIVINVTRELQNTFVPTQTTVTLKPIAIVRGE